MPEYIEREALLRDGAAQKVGGVFDKAVVLGKRGAVWNVGEASLCAVAVRTRQGGQDEKGKSET